MVRNVARQVYLLCNSALLRMWHEEYPHEVDVGPKRRRLYGASDTNAQLEEFNPKNVPGYHNRKHFRNAYEVSETMFRLAGMSELKWNPKKNSNVLVNPCTFSTLKSQRIVCMDSGHLFLIGLCGIAVTAMVKTLGPVLGVGYLWNTALAHSPAHVSHRRLWIL